MFSIVDLFESSWFSFMSAFTLEHSMIAGYIFKTTTMHSIKQVFSNQIVDLQYHLDNHRKTNTSSCSSDTAVRVRLANQSAVLVTRGGSESTLRSGAVTFWHITWAAALAVALGTAEISGQSLHTNGFLIGFAASLWVAVVSGVGCHSHLQHAATMERKMPKIYVHILEILFQRQDEGGFQWIYEPKKNIDCNLCNARFWKSCTFHHEVILLWLLCKYGKHIWKKCSKPKVLWRQSQTV